ncbi:MAG: Mpo1-like protein [Planctomycetota bacterium]
MTSRTPDQWFDEYGESHQNRLNKILHWICVPSIVASLLALLWAIPVPASVAPWPGINWATLTMLSCLGFYLRLSWQLAVGMLGFVALIVLAILGFEQLDLAPLWLAAIIVFVLAWIGQFIGHKIEGKKPSFFQDIVFLLIGPIWLLGFIYRKLGIRY